MNAVIVEPEADEQCVEPERALEIAADRNRAAHSDDDRLRLPFVMQRALGGGERREVVRQHLCARTLVTDELDGAIRGNALFDEGLEIARDRRRILIADETE